MSSQLTGGLYLLCIFLLLSPLEAQRTISPDSIPLQLTQAWESYLAEQIQLGLIDEEEAQQAQALYDEHLLAPLDIQTATKDELLRLPLLSEYQVYQLISYRADHRGFKDLSELKLIIGWTPRLLHLLRPLLRCGTKKQALTWQEASLLVRSHWRLRYGRQQHASGQLAHAIGTPDVALFQFSYEVPQYLQAFVAGEKDYGEPWRWQRRTGFDSYNASIKLKRRGFQLLLGDYRIARGCGLLLGQGIFPLNFRSLTPRFPSGIRMLRHSSEMDFSRGFAGRIQGEQWEAGVFISTNRLDGHLSEDGILSNIGSSGLHRTKHELAQRRQGKTNYGGAWVSLYPTKGLELSLQLIHQNWGGAQLRTPAGSHRQTVLQNLKAYSAGSLAYHWLGMLGRLRLDGEVAYTNKRAWGMTQHLSLLQQAWGDLHISLWDIGKDYWTDLGRAGTHGLHSNDELGARLLYGFSPTDLLGSTQLFIEGYRSHTKDEAGQAKRKGYSYGGATSIVLHGKNELTLAYRLRTSDHTETTHRFRLQYAHELAGWQSRLTLLYSKPSAGKGWALLGSSTGKPLDKLQLKAMIGYFDTPTWASRLYTLQPLLAGEYASFLLYGRGEVVSARLQYTPSPSWRFSLRVSHIHQRGELPNKTTGVLQLDFHSI